MTVPDIRGSSPELPPPSQPIFNLPPVITWLAGILIAIHVVSTLFLSRDAAFELIIAFGFLPARYSADFLPGVALPGVNWPAAKSPGVKGRSVPWPDVNWPDVK